MIHTLKKIVPVIVAVFLITYCNEPWDEHAKLNENTVSENIMEVIGSYPELSIFYQLLQDFDYDTILSKPKSYSVWVPNNTALESIDDDILNSSEFVANHIVFKRISYYSPVSEGRVKTLAGKYIDLDYTNSKVNTATLTTKDIPASNGILHIIDKGLVPQRNIWDIMESLDICQNHLGFLKSLSDSVFDPEAAVQVGVDPNTGEPIYEEGTGMVWRNPFLDKVRNLKDEEIQSTVFLVADHVFDSEFDKLWKYFVPEDSAQVDYVTKWRISRDLVFPEKILPDEMPNKFTSMYGVQVPFNSAAQLTDPIYASNGIIYLLDDCSIDVENKILPITIEGEDTTRIIHRYVTGFTGFTRQRAGASGGYDFLLDNHGENPGYIRYETEPVCAMKYACVWKVVNDFQGSYRNPTSDTLKQKLDRVFLEELIGEHNYEAENYKFGTASPITSLIPIIDSTYTTAVEDTIGVVFFKNYREDLWLQITGAGSNTTVALDYLKLVPIFE